MGLAQMQGTSKNDLKTQRKPRHSTKMANPKTAESHSEYNGENYPKLAENFSFSGNSTSMSTPPAVDSPTLQLTQLCSESVHSDWCEGQDETEKLDFEYRPVHFFDLPWDQVICSQILPFLKIKDFFRLRCVSSEFRDLIQLYFKLQFHVNTNMMGDHFTPTAFRILTQESSSLRSICVRGAKSWLTNDVLLPVIRTNPLLEKLDLAKCIALSGAAVYAIGVNCDNIKHLCLEDCVWLQTENFFSFMTCMRHLEFLDLSGCWNLDDDLVVHLMPFTPRMKHLLLANLYGLTDRSIVAIAHSCPNLIHLSIKGCWRVTDGAVKLLSQYCCKLRALQVKDCRNITEESLAFFRKKRALIDKPGPAASDRNKLEHVPGILHRIRPVL